MKDHRYIIREQGRFGFIDREGQVVIEPQYLAAEDFHNGFALVELIDHWVPLGVYARRF